VSKWVEKKLVRFKNGRIVFTWKDLDALRAERMIDEMHAKQDGHKRHVHPVLKVLDRNWRRWLWKFVSWFDSPSERMRRLKQRCKTITRAPSLSDHEQVLVYFAEQNAQHRDPDVPRRKSHPS
jgi:hypothetical protein